MLTNFRQWKIKIFHISENTIAEGSVMKNFKSIGQESNSVDHLIFQIVTKMLYIFISNI